MWTWIRYTSAQLRSQKIFLSFGLIPTSRKVLFTWIPAETFSLLLSPFSALLSSTSTSITPKEMQSIVSHIRTTVNRVTLVTGGRKMGNSVADSTNGSKRSMPSWIRTYTTNRTSSITKNSSKYLYSANPLSKLNLANSRNLQFTRAITRPHIGMYCFHIASYLETGPFYHLPNSSPVSYWLRLENWPFSNFTWFVVL